VKQEHVFKKRKEQWKNEREEQWKNERASSSKTSSFPHLSFFLFTAVLAAAVVLL